MIWKLDIPDIDKAIDALGDKASEYSRDGLRAVAYLGGKAGMKKFVRSNGEYNPEDELGSSLSEYYEKFIGSALTINLRILLSNICETSPT